MVTRDKELAEKIKAIRKRREERNAERMAKVKDRGPAPKVGKTTFKKTAPSATVDSIVHGLREKLMIVESDRHLLARLLERERERRERAETALEELKAQISEETGQEIAQAWVSGITDEDGNPICPPEPPKENPYENNDKFGAF